MSDQWLSAGSESELAPNDVRRRDVGDATFAVVKTGDGTCVVIDGLCTHGKAHLADGFVDGDVIECPKHNGRFNAVTGAAVATPARVAIRTHETRVRDGLVEFRIA
ncbi:MAG: non-heme iron oxygenase ferredoxin subunit [Actinobacteria bacterium]|nr:non-heme iron oxygenase ferredoxin subunit [Actinomycetota bacterium]